MDKLAFLNDHPLPMAARSWAFADTLGAAATVLNLLEGKGTTSMANASTRG